MNEIISQLSYPVFLYLVWLFFAIASVFAFVVGLGLVLHRPAIQRLSAVMNRWVSVRRWMKPLSIPRYLEPALLGQPVRVGLCLAAGAILSILVLLGLDPVVFTPLYIDLFPAAAVPVLAGYTRDFLLAGNVAGLLLGLLMMAAPRRLSSLIAYTDSWLSVRRRTKALALAHDHVDRWVLAHARVSGLVLMVMALGLMAAAMPQL